MSLRLGTSGFYAGEVLVRGFGFRWVIADPPEFELPEVMQHAIVAPHRDGATSFIITKAFKRVENGDEDSLAFFGEALLAGGWRRCAKPSPVRDPRSSLPSRHCLAAQGQWGSGVHNSSEPRSNPADSDRSRRERRVSPEL